MHESIKEAHGLGEAEPSLSPPPGPHAPTVLRRFLGHPTAAGAEGVGW